MKLELDLTVLVIGLLSLRLEIVHERTVHLKQRWEILYLHMYLTKKSKNKSGFW